MNVAVHPIKAVTFAVARLGGVGDKSWRVGGVT
jgi:hypothetical protein